MNAIEKLYFVNPANALALTDAHLQRSPARLTQAQIAAWRADAIVLRANAEVRRRAQRPAALLRWLVLLGGLGALAWWINAAYYWVVLPCAACWVAVLPMLIRARTLRGSLPFNQLVILLLGALAAVLTGRLLGSTPQYASVWTACGSLACLLPPALITLRWVFLPPVQDDLALYPPADPAQACVVIVPLTDANLERGVMALSCAIELPSGEHQIITANLEPRERIPALYTLVAVRIARLIEQPDGAWRADAAIL